MSGRPVKMRAQQTSEQPTMVRDLEMEQLMHNHLAAEPGWLAEKLRIEGKPAARRATGPFAPHGADGNLAGSGRRKAASGKQLPGATHKFLSYASMGEGTAHKAFPLESRTHRSLKYYTCRLDSLVPSSFLHPSERPPVQQHRGDDQEKTEDKQGDLYGQKPARPLLPRDSGHAQHGHGHP